MTAQVAIENLLLDRASGEALSRQLYQQLRGLVDSRVLLSGQALPSTRVLASDLGLGRNTVIAAYEQLALEGYVNLKRGAAPVVSDLPHRPAAAPERSKGGDSDVSARGRIIMAQPYHHGSPGMVSFHPGLPDPGNFPFNTWSKLLTRRAKQAKRDLFGTYHVTGYPDLREAIARYLGASRGVTCTAEQIVITNGAQSAFDVLARLLLDPGDALWMEEPGYYGACAAFLSAGARLLPLHVDESGWRIEPPAERPRAIFVTPSCQHPLGVTMPMEQRLNLLRLAAEWNAWIIEDDYDSEYRFHGQPIPALQSISMGGHVVCVGTFAKMLFPAMRLGFMVVPDSLREGIAAALSTTGQFAPLLTQAALADFITEGYLSRHLRRMRRLYTARREVFMALCEEHLSPWLSLRPTGSGIQLVGHFHDNLDDRAIAAAAKAKGVNVSPLSIQYRHAGGHRGLLMGFAASDEKMMTQAMLRLKQVFRAL